MASESTETVTVRLPPDLDSWLDEQARELGVDPETVLVQMAAAYRATVELDGDLDAAEFEFGPPSDERVEAAVEASVEDAVETVERLETRVDSTQDEFQAKLEDVRERVIQVKQEADAKAPVDHDHEEFERLVALGKHVDELQEEVAHLTDRLEATLPEQETALEELETEFDTVQERLQTVAWTVRDLQDSVERDTGLAAVERVKRAAAKADVDRARCENCGNGVDIALLTDPQCPHCEATLTDVEEASGLFSKPQLLVASQLESGADDE